MTIVWVWSLDVIHRTVRPVLSPVTLVNQRGAPSRHDAAISLGHDVQTSVNSNRQKFQFTLNQDTPRRRDGLSKVRSKFGCRAMNAGPTLRLEFQRTRLVRLEKSFCAFSAARHAKSSIPLRTWNVNVAQLLIGLGVRIGLAASYPRAWQWGQLFDSCKPG